MRHVAVYGNVQSDEATIFYSGDAKTLLFQAVANDQIRKVISDTPFTESEIEFLQKHCCEFVAV